MTKSLREQRREELLEKLTAGGRTRAAGVTLGAELLHVSVDTIKAWLKPAGGKSSNPIPLGYMELLDYKFEDPKYRARLKVLKDAA